MSFDVPLQYLYLGKLFFAELALERFGRVSLHLPLLLDLNQAKLALLKGKCLSLLGLLSNCSLGSCVGVIVRHLDDALHHPGHVRIQDQRGLRGLAAQAEGFPGLLAIYFSSVLAWDNRTG